MSIGGTRATADWFAVAERGLRSASANAAASLGPAIAPPVLTVLTLRLGWRPMFMIMSAAGFVVAVV